MGDYIRVPGGQVALVRADDLVEASLGGACAHCPASELTLCRRLERGVRVRYPGLWELVAAPTKAARGRRLYPSGAAPTPSLEVRPAWVARAASMACAVVRRVATVRGRSVRS